MSKGGLMMLKRSMVLMTDTRKLPEMKPRVETGVVEFGDDWPGVFIRGDQAAYYSKALDDLITYRYNDPLTIAAAEGLLKLLTESNIANGRGE